MLREIKKEFPHIKRVISYQDTAVHRGTIYKASGWEQETEPTFTTWKNRKDFLRTDQSTGEKIRWGKRL